MFFPSNYRWIYYFDRSRIYEGGATITKIFPIAEAPFFIRSNSVVPIANSLWLVYLTPSATPITKTIIYSSNYSDDVSITYGYSHTLSISVYRYYENEACRAADQSSSMEIRLIGVDIGSYSDAIRIT